MRKNDIQVNKVYTNIARDLRLVQDITEHKGFATMVKYITLNSHREPIKPPKLITLHSFTYWAYQEDIIGSAVYRIKEDK